MTESTELWLGAGYRVVRQLAGDRESPWPGALVCDPEGATSVAVPAELLGCGWTGWDADASGHLLAPLDILRRSDGHDVLLPVCPEQLDEFLRRRDAGADLSIGEAVTVAVSLLRGIADLPGETSAVRGTWWLTEDGRPVLAGDTGGDAVDETLAHLRSLAATVPELRDPLESALEAASDARRRARDLARVEEEIFAVGAPLALATTTFGPRRARGVAAPAERSDADDAASGQRSWLLTLSRHLDAEWAELISHTTTAAWRALRSRRAGRRQVWLVAAGLAGVVLIGGLMWPTADGGPATADVPPAVATPVPGPAPDPPANPLHDSADTAIDGETDPPPSPEAADDLALVADDLLTARQGCGQDTACLDGVQESSALSFPSGVADLPSDQRTVTVLDEFGGAAVVRAEAIGSDAPAQLVVLVRAEGRWLLRDIYDIQGQ